MSGRSRQHIEVAVAVDAQRHLATRAGPARSGPGAFVEQVLRIGLAQPVQRERRPGAVSEQLLARDAHRRIDREAAAVFSQFATAWAASSGSRPRRTNPRNSRWRTESCTRDGGGIETAGGMEYRPVGRCGFEHAIDDDTVKTEMSIAGRVKAEDGTYHALAFAKYAHRYLAEFKYRFNRRFNMKTLLPRLLAALVGTPPVSARVLRATEFAR